MKRRLNINSSYIDVNIKDEVVPYLTHAGEAVFTEQFEGCYCMTKKIKISLQIFHVTGPRKYFFYFEHSLL